MRYNTKRGFTLIELLVVVLIIGILAAVAVPQYQKAVRKARLTEAKLVLKQLTEAQDLYILSGGDMEDYPTSVSDWNQLLDIEIPATTKNWTFSIFECEEYNGKIGCANQASPKNGDTGYSIFYTSPNYYQEPGKFVCASSDICTTYFGATVSEEDDSWYLLP